MSSDNRTVSIEEICSTCAELVAAYEKQRSADFLKQIAAEIAKLSPEEQHKNTFCLLQCLFNAGDMVYRRKKGCLISAEEYDTFMTLMVEKWRLALFGKNDVLRSILLADEERGRYIDSWMQTELLILQCRKWTTPEESLPTLYDGLEKLVNDALQQFGGDDSDALIQRRLLYGSFVVTCCSGLYHEEIGEQKIRAAAALLPTGEEDDYDYFGRFGDRQWVWYVVAGE
jgi:hypothetical protein